MSATPTRTDALPRTLGLRSAVTIVVGITIGSGVFRSAAGIGNRLPGPGAMLAVWVVGGTLAMCGALALAEVASTYPKTGGIYVFLREGWGRLAAFLFGWAELVIIRAAEIGAISITFAEYFLRVPGFDPAVAPYGSYARYTAAAAILLTSGFNIVGLRWSALVTSATTLAKHGGLLFIIFLAFSIELPKSGGHFTPFFPPGAFSFAPFGLALVSVLWAFDAFVTAILPFYVLGVAAIFVLRRRPGYAPAFRCPGYPVVPILFILGTLYLLVNAVVDETTRWPTIAVFGVIIAGIPVYYATVGRRLAPPDGARTAAGETA